MSLDGLAARGLKALGFGAGEDVIIGNSTESNTPSIDENMGNDAPKETEIIPPEETPEGQIADLGNEVYSAEVKKPFKELKTEVKSGNDKFEYNELYLKAINYGKSLLGATYSHSNTEKSLDCSQFVLKCLNKIGLKGDDRGTNAKLANSLYVYYVETVGITPKYNKNEFKKGDLVFWYEPSENKDGGTDHSDNQMYHVAFCTKDSRTEHGKTYCSTIESTTDQNVNGVHEFEKRELYDSHTYVSIPREKVYTTVIENAQFAGNETIKDNNLPA